MSPPRWLALLGVGLAIAADPAHLQVDWPLSMVGVVLIRQHQRGRVCHDRGRDRDRQSDCPAQIRERFRRPRSAPTYCGATGILSAIPVTLSLPEHAVCNFNERNVRY
jgi:hypothetical protein